MRAGTSRAGISAGAISPRITSTDMGSPTLEAILPERL